MGCFPSGAFDFSCLLVSAECRPLSRDPLAKPGATLLSIVGRGIAGSFAVPRARTERAGRKGKGSGAGRGRGPGACLPPSLAPPGPLAQGARDEGGEPGAPLGP